VVQFSGSTIQLYDHGHVRHRIAYALESLLVETELGDYLNDGPLVSNEEANLSVNPDGVFVSKESVRLKLVRLIEGVERGLVEIEGAPDMVLEVVSDSSVEKDTVVLPEKYWKAGIREYWLVDARSAPVRFDIFHYTRKGYVAVRKHQGWLKSAVFGKSFRLVQRTSSLGHPTCTLESR